MDGMSVILTGLLPMFRCPWNASFVHEDAQFPSEQWTTEFLLQCVYLFSLLARNILIFILIFFLNTFCKNTSSLFSLVSIQTNRETDDTSFFFSWSCNQQLRGLWFNLRGHLSSVKCFSSNREWLIICSNFWRSAWMEKSFTKMCRRCNEPHGAVLFCAQNIFSSLFF